MGIVEVHGSCFISKPLLLSCGEAGSDAAHLYYASYLGTASICVGHSFPCCIAGDQEDWRFASKHRFRKFILSLPRAICTIRGYREIVQDITLENEL